MKLEAFLHHCTSSGDGSVPVNKNQFILSSPLFTTGVGKGLTQQLQVEVLGFSVVFFFFS